MSKHVVVTGGASGIGAEIAQTFARENYSVTVIDIATLSNNHDDHIQFIKCDLTDLPQLQATFKTIEPVDILVNNAGCDNRHAAEIIDENQWDMIMDTNLRHYFFASQAVFHEMKRRGSGVIINIASVSTNPDLSVYVAAKGGVINMTYSLARRWAQYGIRVNCISPGWVLTDRQLALWVNRESEQRRQSSQLLKDWILPKDVAYLVLFLAGDRARMITGQNYVIDGGRSKL